MSLPTEIWNDILDRLDPASQGSLAIVLSQQDRFPLENGTLDACTRGYVSLVKYMIDAGCAFGPPELTGAAQNGHGQCFNLVRYHLRHTLKVDDLNKAAYQAAFRGHLDIVQRARLAGASLQGAQLGAANGGHVHVLRAIDQWHMVRVEPAALEATIGDHVAVLQYLADEHNWLPHRLNLRYAARHGSVAVFQYLRGPTIPDDVCQDAVDHGQMGILNLFSPDEHTPNLRIAAFSGHVEVLKRYSRLVQGNALLGQVLQNHRLSVDDAAAMLDFFLPRANLKVDHVLELAALRLDNVSLVQAALRFGPTNVARCAELAKAQGLKCSACFETKKRTFSEM